MGRCSLLAERDCSGTARIGGRALVVVNDRSGGMDGIGVVARAVRSRGVTVG